MNAKVKQSKTNTTGKPLIKADNTFINSTEEQLQYFINDSGSYYWEEDAEYRLTRINHKDGFEPETESHIIGKRFFELEGSPVEDGETWESHLAVRDARQSFKDLVIWRSTGKNKGQYLSISGQPVFDREGIFQGYCGICKDISNERQYEHHANTCELAAIGICHVDSKQKFVYVNSYLCQMLGYSKEELLKMTITQISYSVHEQVPDTIRQDLKIKKIDSFKMEKRYLCKDRSIIWASVTIAVKHAPNGSISHDISIIEDITKRKQAEERAQYLATYDELTNLPNRVFFSNILQQAIVTANRYSRKFAVLFIDLDRFKQINDSFGHTTGDQLLSEMSDRLKAGLRSSDFVARLGGDEFAVLVQEITTLDVVEGISRKILASILKPLEIQGQQCRVTASIGIAMYPEDAGDAQSLMNNADIAMYLAKEEGKNNFQFYSDKLQSRSIERLALEANLSSALDNNEFEVYYQPKVASREAKVSSVEALLRWKNPELGQVRPDHFIPVAEEIGMIIPLGKWVLQTTCEQAIKWQQQGIPELGVAVNLSPRQFQDPGLLPFIKDVLANTKLNPELLEFEITETMMVNDREQAIKQLIAIKKMGIKIAIDDFGVGYSSLSQLKLFPIDTLKIDRSFIREIPNNTEDNAIAKAIIVLGKSLGLKIVAEGVETIEQMTFFKALDCDEIQGYLFSKPLCAEDFEEFMRKGIPKIC